MAAPAKKPIGAIGTIALVIGAGALTVYMLDLHSHRCEVCNYKWSHLGAFNLGSASAHSCKVCGTTQWFKDGVQHVFRDPLHSTPSSAPNTPVARLKEIREGARLRLPSATAVASLREVPSTAAATEITAPRRYPATKENTP